MQITKTVKSFLDRTGTRNKVYFFYFEEDIDTEEMYDEEGVHDWYEPSFEPALLTFYVWEVAGEYTRSGGKLYNINEKELARKFAEMNGFKNCDVRIVDRSRADACLGN